MREAMEGRQVLLVAEADGRIIGQIFIQLQGLPSDPRHEPGTGYFYAFRVRPEYRNRGIGTALMEAAEASLKMAAYHRALIGVAMKNYAARRLYERRGYSLLTEDSGEWSFTDHRDRVYRIAEPTYIMEKRLDLGE
jgi:ribosomal protein S18 acetylase RimI-like enzyme